jgi:hypothetical protein
VLFYEMIGGGWSFPFQVLEWSPLSSVTIIHEW